MIEPSSINLSSLPSVSLKLRSQLPEAVCIYFVVDSQNQIQYIGRSTNLRKRWLSHHRVNQLESIDGIRIIYLIIDSVELLPEIEKALIEWFSPPLNGSLLPRVDEDEPKKRGGKRPGAGGKGGSPATYGCKTKVVRVPEKVAELVPLLLGRLQGIAALYDEYAEECRSHSSQSYAKLEEFLKQIEPEMGVIREISNRMS
jgi:hypothetical protein